MVHGGGLLRAALVLAEEVVAQPFVLGGEGRGLLADRAEAVDLQDVVRHRLRRARRGSA